MSDFCLCLRPSLQPFPTSPAPPLPPVFVVRQGAVTACESMELLAVAAFVAQSHEWSTDVRVHASVLFARILELGIRS